MNLKMKIILSFVQTYQKKKEVPYIEMSPDIGQKRRKSPFMEISSDNGRNRQKTPYLERSHDNYQKEAYGSHSFQLLIHFLSFIVRNCSLLSATSVLSHSAIRQHWFIRQVNLNRLCGLWKVSRQLWTIPFLKKWLQLLGFKTWSVHERRQQRLLPNTKSHNGRSRFQPLHTIEESAGHCRRKLWQRGKLVTSADTNNVQSQGWKIQTGP